MSVPAALLGRKLLLCSCEGAFLQLDALPNDLFDPLVETGLSVQPGQKSRSRRKFARHREGGWLGAFDANGRLPGRIVIRLGNHDLVNSFLIRSCRFHALLCFIHRGQPVIMVKVILTA